MNKMNEFKSDFKRILSNGLYWKSSESVLTLIKQAYLLYSFGISSHLDGFYLGMSIVSLSIYALGESFDLYLVSRRGWSGSYRDIQLLMYLFLVALLSLALGYLLIDSEIIVFKPYVHLLPSFILIACSYFPYRYLLTYLKLQKKINQAYSVEFLFSATVLLYIVCIDNSFNGLFDSIFFALATSIILALIMIEKSPIQLGENLSMSGFWKFHIGHIFDFLSDLLEKSLLGMIGVGVISIYSYMQYAVLFCKKVVVGNGLYVHLLNEDGYDVGLKNRLAYLFKLFLLSNIFVCVMIFLVHEVARFSEIRINFHDELIFFSSFIIPFVFIDFLQKIIYIKSTDLVIFLKFTKVISIFSLYALSKIDLIKYGFIYLFGQYFLYLILTSFVFYIYVVKQEFSGQIRIDWRVLLLSALSFLLNLSWLIFPF